MIVSARDCEGGEELNCHYGVALKSLLTRKSGDEIVPIVDHRKYGGGATVSVLRTMPSYGFTSANLFGRIQRKHTSRLALLRMGIQMRQQTPGTGEIRVKVQHTENVHT